MRRPLCIAFSSGVDCLHARAILGTDLASPHVWDCFFKTLLSRGQSASILGTIFNPVLWSTLLFRGVDLIRVISMEGQCTISALRQTFILMNIELIHCSQYETPNDQ
jgi:hypothetical protein